MQQTNMEEVHDWAGQVIHWELSKILKFDFKWYLHKPESVLVNEVYKILCDFETQSNQLILARRPDLVMINK